MDVVKKMGKQMDNFVSQGEARERTTRSCNARIIRFDETKGETTQQLLDKVNNQILQGQMKLAIKAVTAVRQPISRRAETKPGTVHTRAVLVTFATAEDRKAIFQNRVILKGTHWGLEEDLTKVTYADAKRNAMVGGCQGVHKVLGFRVSSREF